MYFVSRVEADMITLSSNSVCVRCAFDSCSRAAPPSQSAGNAFAVLARGACEADERRSHLPFAKLNWVSTNNRLACAAAAYKCAHDCQTLMHSLTHETPPSHAASCIQQVNDWEPVLVTTLVALAGASRP